MSWDTGDEQTSGRAVVARVTRVARVAGMAAVCAHHARRRRGSECEGLIELLARCHGARGNRSGPDSRSSVSELREKALGSLGEPIVPAVAHLSAPVRDWPSDYHTGRPARHNTLPNPRRDWQHPIVVCRRSLAFRGPAGPSGGCVLRGRAGPECNKTCAQSGALPIAAPRRLGSPHRSLWSPSPRSWLAWVRLTGSTYS